MISESALEDLCLTWFNDQGWESLYGPDIGPEGESPERVDFVHVVLENILLTQITELNPEIPPETLSEVVASVTRTESLNLIKNNRAFHKLLIEGVPVEYSRDGRPVNALVRLVDFGNVENNNFLVVNQFAVQGPHQARRTDLVAFINGLPIALIELKNPASQNADIWDAYNQLETYKKDIPDFFIYNTALIISDGFKARIGSLSANRDRYLPWRTIKNEEDTPLVEYQLEKVVKGFFDPELLLDYIRNFIVFEVNGDLITKKIAAYHQFHAVREAVRATLIATGVDVDRRFADEHYNPLNTTEKGARKAGVFWHTQGSGKSISMVFYAGKLLREQAMNNPTIVVVTDRQTLDGQLYQTFVQGKDIINQTPEQAESREDLRAKLSARTAGGIIFTTVQKFSLLADEDKHPTLSERDNIVVISDEAHRSQYSLEAKLDPKTGLYRFGYARYLRDALPKATFLGFTGTPISQEDRDTRGVFGEYISIYDIKDAVDDGATVPIYYESRLARLDINQAEIDKLNAKVEELLEDEEDIALREKTKGSWATLENLVGSAPRLKQIARDMVRHFEKRNEVFPGKGMIVCMSREVCVHMYDEIIKLRPDWHSDDPEKGAIKVIMTGSATDQELLKPHIYKPKTKKRLEVRFKDENDPLQLVIVRDMWLTGFDVPPCHTMYIDKPMRDHSLMQAIARVNRVYGDKPGGLIVDYIGIGGELREALKIYAEAKGKGEPTLRAEDALIILEEKLDIVRGMFAGFDYSDYKTNAMQLLPLSMNHILGLDEGKTRFLDVMVTIKKAYSLCGALEEVDSLRKEIAFFAAIKAALLKYTAVDKKRSDAEKYSVLKQILDNAIVAEGVVDIFKMVGLDKPEIGLLSEEFLEEVRNLKTRNLAVELLEKLLQDQIKARMATDVVLKKKYSDRILEALRKYHNRSIETAQVIEELIEIAKSMQRDNEASDAMGLNPDERAFYHALANNESAVRELGDEILKKIAAEITEKLRKSTTVDWQVRDSVRARLRNLVRRALRKWKYPPDGAQEAIELCLKQAEVLSHNWSVG